MTTASPGKAVAQATRPDMPASSGLAAPGAAAKMPVTYVGHALDRRRFVRCGGAALFVLGGIAAPGCDRSRSETPEQAGLRIIDERRTRFGRLAVVERGRKRYLAYGPGARLVYQSVVDLDRPHELSAPYMRLMMLGVVYADPYSRMAHIGVGAGNMAGYVIRNFASVVVDAVDIDSHAVELGMRYFGLRPNPRLRVHIADGRAWLAASRERFDVVMLDAYDDRTIPPALRDPAFFAIVASRLAPRGVVMQNVFLPYVERAALLAAISRSFAHVHSYRVGDSEVLAAYQGAARDPAELRARARQLDASLRPVHSLAGLLEYRRMPVP